MRREVAKIRLVNMVAFVVDNNIKIYRIIDELRYLVLWACNSDDKIRKLKSFFIFAYLPLYSLLNKHLLYAVGQQ